MANPERKRVPLLVPDMPSADELLPYLRRIDQHRWYTNFGPLVNELETRLASLHSSASALSVQTVSNATLGLELALTAMNLRPGSSILIPALTFIATASAVVRAGHAPVLCDVTPDSWLLTPAIAHAALRQQTIAAVLPVCTYGCPQDATGWEAFRRDTGIPVLVDAAGAFGNQAAVGSVPYVFSLHATKSLGAGEGGYIVSTDQAFLQQIKRLSNFGIDVSTGYAMAPGTNAKLSEYHAAAALASLDAWKRRRSSRVELHRNYVKQLSESNGLLRLQERPLQGVYTILSVLLPEGFSAPAAARAFEQEGIETRRWYCPTLDRHPAYRDYSLAGPLTTAPALDQRLLGLPFHPALDDGDISRICARLAAIR